MTSIASQRMRSPAGFLSSNSSEATWAARHRARNEKVRTHCAPGTPELFGISTPLSQGPLDLSRQVGHLDDAGQQPVEIEAGDGEAGAGELQGLGEADVAEASTPTGRAVLFLLFWSKGDGF
jgi:hypothetical protein